MVRNILITGGYGFIGTNLQRYLGLEGGYSLRVLDDLSSFQKRFPRPVGVEVVIGDIRNRESVNRAMAGMDAVVHLAARTTVIESWVDPERAWDVNVNGTLNLLEICRRHGVRRFIFASSNAAVGDHPLPIDENTVPRPISPYGASKLAGEALCSAYWNSFNLKTISLRFANCYGPHSEHKSSVVPTFMKRIKEGKPFVIHGDGYQTRDFIHVSDVCQAIYLSLTAADADGEVFQIGSGKETTIIQLARTIGEETKSNFQIIHEREQAAEIKRAYSDIRKAKRMLGFDPEVGLREGLSNLWSGYNNQDGGER